jgi:hypothetical protein
MDLGAATTSRSNLRCGDGSQYLLPWHIDSLESFHFLSLMGFQTMFTVNHFLLSNCVFACFYKPDERESLGLASTFGLNWKPNIILRNICTNLKLHRYMAVTI